MHDPRHHSEAAKPGEARSGEAAKPGEAHSEAPGLAKPPEARSEALGEAQSVAKPDTAAKRGEAQSGDALSPWQHIGTKQYEVWASASVQRAFVRDLTTGRRSPVQTGPQAMDYYNVAKRLLQVNKKTFNHWCRHHAWEDDAKTSDPTNTP